jgi:hypothetical protein
MKKISFYIWHHNVRIDFTLSSSRLYVPLIE